MTSRALNSVLSIICVVTLVAAFGDRLPTDSGNDIFAAYNSPSGNRSDWMRDGTSEFGWKRVSELCIPASHDSASYAITGSSAVAAGSLASYIPSGVLAYGSRVFEQSVRWGRTQRWSLYEQLLAGVRFFDLRIEFVPSAYDASNATACLGCELWLVHGFRSIRLRDALSQVYDFSRQHRTEIVFLNFAQFIAFPSTEPAPANSTYAPDFRADELFFRELMASGLSLVPSTLGWWGCFPKYRSFAANPAFTIDEIRAINLTALVRSNESDSARTGPVFVLADRQLRPSPAAPQSLANVQCFIHYWLFHGVEFWSQYYARSSQSPRGVSSAYAARAEYSRGVYRSAVASPAYRLKHVLPESVYTSPDVVPVRTNAQLMYTAPVVTPNAWTVVASILTDTRAGGLVGAIAGSLFGAGLTGILCGAFGGAAFSLVCGVVLHPFASVLELAELSVPAAIDLMADAARTDRSLAGSILTDPFTSRFVNVYALDFVDLHNAAFIERCIELNSRRLPSRPHAASLASPLFDTDSEQLASSAATPSPLQSAAPRPPVRSYLEILLSRIF